MAKIRNLIPICLERFISKSIKKIIPLAIITNGIINSYKKYLLNHYTQYLCISITKPTVKISI